MSATAPIGPVAAAGEARLARRETVGQLAKSKTFIVGIVYLVATFVADILYSVFNPRIRYGAAE